jgi:hypothetical protein
VVVVCCVLDIFIMFDDVFIIFDDVSCERPGEDLLLTNSTILLLSEIIDDLEVNVGTILHILIGRSRKPAAPERVSTHTVLVDNGFKQKYLLTIYIVELYVLGFASNFYVETNSLQLFSRACFIIFSTPTCRHKLVYLYNCHGMCSCKW